MERLDTTTWQHYFETKEHYLNLRKRWAQLHKEGKLEGKHFLMYAILRGKDWRKCFATPTKTWCREERFKTAKHFFWILKSKYFMSGSFKSLFGDLVTRDMLDTALSCCAEFNSDSDMEKAAYNEYADCMEG